MARPQKKGMGYFPLDVDIFEDDKLFDVSNEFGPVGEVIYLRLLCLIYKNGYYYKFESLDKLVLMLIKSIGNRWVRDKKTVSEVIPFLAKCNLFSSELMQENVLTSQSIQRRYQKACERRQLNTNLPYWLIENPSSGLISVPKNQINVDNNPINDNNNSINVDDNTPKVKESKLNNIKVVVAQDTESCINESYADENEDSDDEQENQLSLIGKQKVVLLSSKQIGELLDVMDLEAFNYYLDKLENFITNKNAYVKNHYQTILKWYKEDKKL